MMSALRDWPDEEPWKVRPRRSPESLCLGGGRHSSQQVIGRSLTRALRGSFQSSDHVYYLGEPGTLIMPNRTRVNGGIAVAKTEDKPTCHLFIQIRDDSGQVRDMRMGALVAEFASLEKDRIREFKSDRGSSELLSDIEVRDDVSCAAPEASCEASRELMF